MPAQGGRATYEASPNIALVKYWGVRDAVRALPYNSSISVTLAGMRTRTTVEFDGALSADSFELNGVPAPAKATGSVTALLDRIRSTAKVGARARVVSDNDFPTASGLASSASGFAALAGAGAAAAGLDLSDRELSQLARFGSGSACRSIFGGFVEWKAGHRMDGADCYAERLHDERYWPALRDVVVLIEGAPEKEVRSAEAMQATVATSPEYAKRQAELPRRITAIREAIAARDAWKLFPLVMEECDSFRLVCETTTPSYDYLTEASRRVLAEVRRINERASRAVAGYTHDAGAHVHVFTLEADAAAVQEQLGAVEGVRTTQVLEAGRGGRRVDRRR